MGVFSRFLDIVNANINSLLDKAEDPQKMLRMMIQEMEDTLIEIKSSCAAKMANRTKLNRQHQETEETIKRWQSRAELAVEKGRDDLAREALLEKKRTIAALARIEEELKNYDTLIDDSKKEINQLEDKLEEVKKKYRMLMEKQRQEEERSRTQSSMKQDPMDHFNSMEEKIDRMRAENDLNKPREDLEKDFQDLEGQDDIEKQLNELKKKTKE